MMRIPIEFKLIRIPGKKIDAKTINQIIFSAVNAELGIKVASFDDFRTHTTQSNVKRYIMAPRSDFKRYLKEMQASLPKGERRRFDQNLNKGQFKPHKMPKLGRPDENPAKADKRYGAIDIHKIDVRYDQDGKNPNRKKSIIDKMEEHSDEVRRLDYDMKQHITHDLSWVVNLCLNPKIPIMTFRILDAIAARISRIVNAEVLALEMIPSKKGRIYYEHISKFESGTKASSMTVPFGKHIFTRYKQNSGIEIRKILSAMDSNIDMLMAPYDLAELQQWDKEFQASREFMEKSGLDKTEKSEYINLMEDISKLTVEIKQTTESLYKDPCVQTTYFMIQDPRKLAKFKWEDLQKEDESKLN